MSDFSIRGPLVDADAIGLPPVEGLDLPTVQGYTINDDDAGVCRPIEADELNTYYVDNNIVAIEPIQPDPWTLDPAHMDAQDLRMTYSTGAQLALRLGSISMDGGPAREDFRKSGGIIYPTDAGARPLFDATNTPFLAALRRNVHAQLGQRAQERLEYAEMVSYFAGAISTLGNAASVKF